LRSAHQELCSSWKSAKLDQLGFLDPSSGRGNDNENLGKELRLIMRTSLRWLSLFMAPALVISLSALMVACSSDDGGDGGDETATLTAANPATGSEVPEGATITLTFSSDPGTVTVNGAATAGAGATRTFTLGADGALSIAWDNGGADSLTYTVTAPDTIPATHTGTSPDVAGDTDVDPGDFADGLTLSFDEPVDVDELTLSTGGSALSWVPTVDGNDVTLQFNADDPIVNETEYEVAGVFIDAGGNKTEVNFSFTTKAKE
jgi:hypothetical protein